MPVLDLTTDELLTTTRSVRRRLDFDRPVEPAVIREVLEIALQAPSPGSEQSWHFVVVTDPAQREALGDLYRKGAVATGQQYHLDRVMAAAQDEQERAKVQRMADSALFLTENIHRAPVLLIPSFSGRPDGRTHMEQAAQWGGIWPATWSFMLAARSRGLGTVLTTLHLAYEQDAASVLGIPYPDVTQVGMIPVAYTKGSSFRPAIRKPLDSVLHWDRW